MAELEGPSAADLIANGPPPPGAGAGGPRPIGVPPGWTVLAPGDPVLSIRPEEVEVPDGRRFEDLTPAEQARLMREQVATRGREVRPEVPRDPRYFTGDEWLPAQLPVEERAALQRSLVEAGLLTGKFRVGSWDRTTRGAYEELLSLSNATGQQPDLILEELLANPASDLAAEVGLPQEREGPRLPNPADIRAIADRVGEEILGRRVTQAELGAVISSVQQSADVAGEFEPPSLDVTTEQVLREQAPEEAAGMDVANAYRSFLSQLGAGGIGGGQ